ELEHERVVRVDNRPIVGRLVLENPRLRSNVRFDVRMTIQMVRRDIQQHGNPRAKIHDALKLKTASLDDVQRARRRSFDLRTQRRANVSSDRDVKPGTLENPS